MKEMGTMNQFCGEVGVQKITDLVVQIHKQLPQHNCAEVSINEINLKFVI
jgi:hypothetical protein